jgi:hypothetical protein
MHSDHCWPCANNYGLVRQVQSWDFRPELVFHPSTPHSKKEQLYIGMELEVSFGSYNNRAVETWLETTPVDLIYAKHDSSVNRGCEIVTHPMQPDWALENFPFDAFQELMDVYGAKPTHSSTGTHVHMNKEAFTTAHLWKMIQLHFRLPGFCKVVGGRENSSYASFEPSDFRLQRNALMQIVKEKNKGQRFQRYSAVNLQNEYTIELRYMRGGIKPDEIRKNIEWAKALFEFTDYLDVKDIRHGALDNQGYLLGWIQAGDYPYLNKWIAERIPSPLNLPERSN